VNVLLLGIQGSGKGTQAKRITSEYGIPHIATGDMLREAVADGTPLGKEVETYLSRGELVPDETVIQLIRDRLCREDASDGFVLDGFPRTMAQSDALDEMLADIGRPLSIVFDLQVPDEVARERLTKRAVEEGRSDDTPDVIDRRIQLYHEETEPIVQHYRLFGNLVGIHGTGTMDEVFSEIQEALEQLRRREEAAERPVREGGPVERVWGNREVPPAGTMRDR
jgi:adenylate kinase